MQRLTYRPVPCWLTLLVALALPLLPRPAAAQTTPIVLTVQLRSAMTNTPVPRIAVQVIDAASNHLLAQGTTDGRGQVRFAQMPPAEVRVRLTGTLPDGTAVRPTPQDRDGIWVRLPGRDWLMDLRVDTDGLVFPDLSAASAGAPDARDGPAVQAGTPTAGAVATVYPTAPLAQAAARPAATRPPAMPAPTTVVETSVSQSAVGPSSTFTGALLLALLLGMIGGVLWLSARHKL